MRFEVKAGGIAGILFALTLLSGAVFVLGLLAGYDVGRQAQIDTSQLATSYPLHSPSASPAPSNQMPTEAANPTMQSASTSGPTNKSAAPPVASADHNLTAERNNPVARPPQPSGPPVRNRFVAASIPPTMPPRRARSPVAADAESTGTENNEAVDQASEGPGDASPEAARKVAQPVHHKPYNIQIEAAMDISGADQMMARLRRLGYPSHLVPTEIGGQRWYKVEVGPYATSEEASTAEATLRQRYDATYGGVARRSSAAQGSANEDSEE